MRRVQRGFTLIEVLVVVSILGVLAGLISVLVTQAQRKRYEFETQQTVTLLDTAVRNYYDDFKRLPPEVMAGFAGSKLWEGLLVSGNTTNECNECLVVALRHPDLRTPLEQLPTPFGNTDDDIWNKVPAGSQDVAAKEILDAYGNPLVYITKTLYETPVQITRRDGMMIEVHAMRRPNGSFYNQDSFQIISLGRNETQDEGEWIDDLQNFTREEE